MLENGPVTLNDVTPSAKLPLLVNVTICAAEVEPTLVFAKASEDGDTPARALKPVPLSVTVLVPALVTIPSASWASPITVGENVTE